MKQYDWIACKVFKHLYQMRILNINTVITSDQLLNLLQEKLNPLFQHQRQSNIAFTIESKSGVIEISQPDIYEGFLFSIEVKGTQLCITRSEHYVDDVNSLTLESILHTLFEQLAGDKGMSLGLEG